MSTTVGQHAVATFTSPVNGTSPIDANSVRSNDNTLRQSYVTHDADPGIHVQSSTLASRPSPGVAGRKWITEDSSIYTLWFDNGSTWLPVGTESIEIAVKANAALAKGDVVKIVGWNNGLNMPEVNKVSSASDIAFGVMAEAASLNAVGYLINAGLLNNIDTSAFSAGDILYPNASGWLTASKPTSGLYQPAAYVLRSDPTNGVIFVEFSAPRIVEASANTASTVVQRDGSGNFSAGTITASLTGNAATATALQTARTLWGQSFNGTANVTGALTSVTDVTASGTIAAGAVTSTGLVTVASLKGTGPTTITNILDEDNMASNSATALATQQSIKAYVDAQVATADTLAEVLANGNTTGANNIIVSSGQKVTTNTIDETTAAAGVTIDSVLLKDNAVTATTFNGTLNGAAPAGSLSGATLASNVVASSLTSVGTLSALTVTAPIAGSVTGSSGSTTGNAATATTLQTPRNINGVSFNGSANITVAADANTLTGSTLASGVTSSSLTGLGTLSSVAVSGATTLNSVAYTWPNADGTTGQILSTNGSGTLAWLTGGGGSGTVNTGVQGYFSYYPSNGTTVDDQSVLFTDNTNLGVGTASPTHKIDVAGNANLTSGNAYKINGTDVLTATALGSGVTSSSLTSVGTLANLTVTNPITGSVTGNAGTATALQAARTINGTSFDGTANITVAADANTLTGSTLASGVTASSLTSVGTLSALTVTAPITGSVTGSSGSTTGNAATATALATARNINGVSFNGTANITVPADAGTLTGATLASNVLASSLTSVGTLSALTMGGTVSAADNVISRPRFTDYAETLTSPSISSNTLTLNIENGNVFTVSLNANITTLTIQNPPASGNGGSFTLRFTADGTGRTVTWGASVKWPGGTAPTLTSTNNKVDTFVFFTTDAGTTWYAFVAGQNA